MGLKVFNITSAFAWQCSAAGRQFVSAGGALWAPGLTLIYHKEDTISKYVCLTVKIDVTRTITKFVNFEFYDA